MATREDRKRFIDTNILLAACDASREAHPVCLNLLEGGLSGEWSLFASGQIFREFLVVATRPVEVNGLGMSPTDALANVAELSRCLRLLEETASVSRRLRELVRRHNLQGKRIHDTNIVATMIEHGLKRIVTSNPDDFRLFAELVVEAP